MRKLQRAGELLQRAGMLQRPGVLHTMHAKAPAR
jgi:hypothetical protein